jgi:AraC-like DNA-binding protein
MGVVVRLEKPDARTDPPRPQRNWSTAALAREVAMSRSVFAARFSSLVGLQPLTYRTRWRLWHASRLLAEENLSVSETGVARWL